MGLSISVMRFDSVCISCYFTNALSIERYQKTRSPILHHFKHFSCHEIIVHRLLTLLITYSITEKVRRFIVIDSVHELYAYIIYKKISHIKLAYQLHAYIGLDKKQHVSTSSAGNLIVQWKCKSCPLVILIFHKMHRKFPLLYHNERQYYTIHYYFYNNYHRQVDEKAPQIHKTSISIHHPLFSLWSLTPSFVYIILKPNTRHTGQ